MPTVLGKVIAAVDAPRGPDVVYRVRVQREWLESGRTVQIQIPRNLACAQCGGGGCDACGGAGALTLRGREDPPEQLDVTLPCGEIAAAGGGGGVTLRIPDSGGRPAADSDLPRGQLLLTVMPADKADPNVILALPGAARPGLEQEAAASASAGPVRWGLPAFFAAVLLLALLGLMARMSGCGM